MSEHYGDPVAEQRALAAGRAVVDLADNGVVTITGPDRLSWLDSLTSQALKGLQPGESTESLLLDINGRIEHTMRVVDDGETLWLLVDAGFAPSLAEFLHKMRFMLRVVVTDVSADYRTLGTFGAPEVSPIVTWIDPWAEVARGGHQYAEGAHPSAEWTYREILVPRSFDVSTLPAAGTWALDALRIAAWRPSRAAEVDERSIPHELDWLRSAVHLNKGCYRGQETVAKVHNLGHPPRRLVLLHLDGSESLLPPVGSEVVLATAAPDPEPSEGPAHKVVGHITSSARHHELGPIALAVIKRTVDPAAVLTVLTDEGSIAAAQEVIVPPSAGAAADVPRIPRLGAVRRTPRESA